jgi:hypothetical protein
MAKKQHKKKILSNASKNIIRHGFMKSSIRSSSRIGKSPIDNYDGKGSEG